MSVVIETTLGDITVDLYVKERPKACLNFLKLCKLKYYNFNLFHTIEQNFLAQTGDPAGDGDKGESIWGVLEGPQKAFFEAEQIPKILHSDVGLLSMVALEDNFIGSQFFFTLGTDLTSLDGIHCVIGEVVEGHEILRLINEAIVDENHRPYKDIRITHTVILDDPFADPRGFRQPSRSPSPTPEKLKNGRIAADEDINDKEGKTDAEIQEMLEEREAKARATILEIVGDLPDAEVAPPENVLFICKLNPVTSDDDLEIIFSRFGKIKSCEVIRDKMTNDSLQYAFIEFEEEKSCIDAYFKMKNVLIDDRRIHVDFSQSVSRVKWRGKGNYTIFEDGDPMKNRSNYRRSRDKDRSQNSRNYEKRRDDDRNDRRRNDDRRMERRRSPRRYSPDRRNRRSPIRRSRSRDRYQSNNRRRHESPPPRRKESSSHKRRSLSNSSDEKSSKRSSKKEKKSRNRSSSDDSRRKHKKSRR